jgi:hypothetical protein
MTTSEKVGLSIVLAAVGFLSSARLTVESVGDNLGSLVEQAALKAEIKEVLSPPAIPAGAPSLGTTTQLIRVSGTRS